MNNVQGLPNVVGFWWNKSDLRIVKIKERFYVLNKWNGESYSDCWEVNPQDEFTEVIGNETYSINPVYDFKENEDEEYPVIGWEVK